MTIKKRFGIARKLKERLVKKEVVTAEQYDQIIKDSQSARMLLEAEEFQFFRDYLNKKKESILDAFVRNKVRDVQERIQINTDLVKIFFTSKEEQEKEMAGQYKLIDELLSDLQGFADMGKEAEEAKKRGLVEIDKDEQKEV